MYSAGRVQAQIFSTRQIEGIELPYSPFILQRLKLFEWWVDDKDTVNRAMLQHVRMRVLETFSWWRPCLPLKPSSDISGFFERLPPTLSEGEIIEARSVLPGFSILSYFLALPNVERLVFKACATHL